MSSLKLLAMKNMDILKNKSLLEIVELCEENDLYKNTIFRSRESVIAFLDIFMTKSKEDFFDDGERQRLKQLYQLRYDLVTGTDCFNFTKALARGFAWNYELVRGESISVSLCRPQKYPSVEPDLAKECRFLGTLPSDICVGVMCDVSVTLHKMYEDIDDDKKNHIRLLSVWEQNADVFKDAKFKRDFYYNMLFTIKNLVVEVDDFDYNIQMTANLSLMHNDEDLIDLTDDVNFSKLESSVFLDYLTDSPHDFDVFENSSLMRFEFRGVDEAFDDYNEDHIVASITCYPFTMS